MTKINHCPASQHNGLERYCVWQGLKFCPYDNKNLCQIYIQEIKPLKQREPMDGRK